MGAKGGQVAKWVRTR